MRSLAVAHWINDDLLGLVFRLDSIRKSSDGPGAWRIQLREIRDRLYAISKQMENDGSSETDEVVYLVVFDALAMLTDSMRGKSVNVHSLNATAALLRGLSAITGKQTN